MVKKLHKQFQKVVRTMKKIKCSFIIASDGGALSACLACFKIQLLLLQNERETVRSQHPFPFQVLIL